MKKNQDDLKDKSGTSKEKTKKTLREKKVEYEGSRWSSLILLGITIIVSFFLYLTGSK